MHCMVDVAVRFRRQGRILMETMVVATRTLCLATRAKRGDTDEIRIMRLLLLHAMTSRLVFRIEHGCGPRQMEKCVRYSEWTFLA